MVPLGIPVASRDLQCNHRLRAGDVSFDAGTSVVACEVIPSETDLLDQYLRVGKKRGDRLRGGDVCKRPTLDFAGKQMLSVSIPTSNALGGILDAGVVVEIRGRSGAVSESKTFRFPNLVIEAVLDGVTASTPGAEITLIVSLPKDSNDTDNPMPSLDVLLGATQLLIVTRGT